MTQEELKAKILNANKAYRAGRPVMSDQAFDDLCDAYKAMVSADEYDAFRDSLHEETGKVKHPFIMGSLDKLKAEEPQEVLKWIGRYVTGMIHISAKIDGISCRLHYGADGKLESATTRGDGYAGVDCTDKVKWVQRVPKLLPTGTGFDIRGELVITKKDFDQIKSQFANSRNACAGIVNQKTPDPKLLGHISFIAYEIMGGYLAKCEQFQELIRMGFTTPWYTEVGNAPKTITVDALEKFAAQDFDYPTDGLVLSSSWYKAENKYRPDGQVAFKLNQLLAETEIVDVEWSEPSKDGRITPVAIIKPTTIGGSTITRVTLNNLDWIKQMGIDLGAKVQLVKSGDVIPKIVKVLKKGGKDIVPPAVCPVCGGKTEVYGPHLHCSNPKCEGRKREEALAFIVNLGIKRIKMSTLLAWNVKGIADLLDFDPAGKGKMGAYFDTELQHRMWEADEVKLFKALPFTDLAEATLDKIIRHYGWASIKAQGEAFLNGATTVSEFDIFNQPAGVGDKTLAAFIGQLGEAMTDLKSIIDNNRYSGNRANIITPSIAGTSAPVTVNNTNNQTGGNNTMTNNIQYGENGSICFTGKLNTMTRVEAQRKAEQAGFEVKNTVTMGLDYLVTNDTESGSSKNRKAKQYGTRIITEDEFLMMVS